MRISKLFAGLFGLLGAALTAVALTVCMRSLDAAPVLLTQPEAAKNQVEAMLEAVCQGDYTTAGSLMYGSPDLGVDRAPGEEAGVLIWDAFVDSMHYELAGDCYATDSGVAWDVVIESLDISSVTANLKERSRTLLAQRVAEAEDVAQVYDENGEYRENVVMEVLLDAVRQAVAEDGVMIRREVTLNLICQDGQWWILGDQALLEAISGGIAG